MAEIFHIRNAHHATFPHRQSSCGSRGRAYAGIAASFGGRYRITAAADPVAARREAIAGLFPSDGIRTFSSSGDFFAAGRLADVLIIATQDADHFEHASTALRAGYDILLEKPAAETFGRCEELDDPSRRREPRSCGMMDALDRLFRDPDRLPPGLFDV